MTSPDAVRSELNNIAKHYDALSKAATVWLGTRGTALKFVSLSTQRQSDAAIIQAQLSQMSRKTRITSQSDLGESECIALAEATDARFATSDSDARNVAEERAITVVTVAELLRIDIDSGRLGVSEVRQLVNRMRDAGTDIGENISGRLDLTRPRRCT